MNRHGHRHTPLRATLRRFIAMTGLALAASLITQPAQAGPSAQADIAQPGPLTSGPGSTNYQYAKWKVRQVGKGYNAAYVFAPAGPTPEHAPLAIITHGYFEYSGYDQMYELVRHTVLAGNVVIYPRYQTSEAGPCPGPFNIEPCVDAATQGIKTALKFLESHPRWTQPDLKRASYFGFSFGGIITTNLANRWEKLNLPKPRAVMLDDPHDGGLAGAGEPALDKTLTGIPQSTKFVCHSGAEGVLSTSPTSSCNALFPRLTTIPARNKSLVMTYPDAHGTPALSSGHGVCAGARGTADAYDTNFCWKSWDALRAVAYTGRWRDYALGSSLRHTSTGAWSDGVPVVRLQVASAAPIQPSS